MNTLIASIDSYKGANYPLTTPENTDTLPDMEAFFSVNEKLFFNELLGAKDGIFVYDYLLSGSKIANDYTPLINGVQYSSTFGREFATTPLVELMKRYCFVKYLENSQSMVAFDGAIIPSNVALANTKAITGQYFEVARRWNILVDMIGDYRFYTLEGYYKNGGIYDYLTINSFLFPNVVLKIWAKKAML